MAGVSAAFVHLRWVARTHALTDERTEVQAAEIRVSVLMGTAFLLGACAAWFSPRWTLVFYTIVPLVLMIHRRIFRKKSQAA